MTDSIAAFLTEQWDVSTHENEDVEQSDLHRKFSKIGFERSLAKYFYVKWLMNAE